MAFWNKPIRVLVVVLCSAAVPQFVPAQQAPNTSGWSVVNPPTPTRRYGMAGCGLGSILLPNGPQALTSIINSLGWNQVFMISSGTSNCQSEDSRQVMLNQEHFMANNFRDVARDAARGGGIQLKGLAQTLGCTGHEYDRFAKLAQDHYQDIFSQPGALAALDAMKTKIISDADLKQSCKYAVLPTGRTQAN
jgi:hypothetical protein